MEKQKLLRNDYSSKFAKEVTQLGILKFLFILRSLVKDHPSLAGLLVKPFESFCNLYPYLEVYKTQIGNYLLFVRLLLMDTLNLMTEVDLHNS